LRKDGTAGEAVIRGGGWRLRVLKRGADASYRGKKGNGHRRWEY